MATARKRISRRTDNKGGKVYTRAGEGPGESPFADVPESKKQAMLADLRRQQEAFRKEQEERSNSADYLNPIRHGVKSERDTQPVQVRMLKAQLKVLKQVAEQENRSSSDVIRDLVDAYIAHCLETWEEGPRLEILRATLRAEEYQPRYPADSARAAKKVGKGDSDAS
ncbi:ribbon-helix-helix protein, CopG family [Caballeronia sp. ATUFL_M2_KS44]|uniref:ribbon-helix-helix protein, CopG family n=1 Tax=Caballeronia sp. ATUFL_M2_KS44 TaxID=2921767 RepID=UPI002028BEEA|nr:ribbon-helix-helix protein, CopG family [Caballeronia sp. ATUFL_M2_KS44]